MADEVPQILVCGLPRSGKTSILKVVFEKMNPHETLFLEQTSKAEGMDVNRNPLLRFRCVDLPVTCCQSEAEIREHLEKSHGVLFVIDAQEEPFDEACKLGRKILVEMKQMKKRLPFDIFIHKVDNFSQGRDFIEDEKTEITRTIHAKLSEDTQENDDFWFHCTSIYDHSLTDALSKVVQKLMPQQLPTLVQCLDQLVSSCQLIRVYLFDLSNKLYLASDSQPVDMQPYELCSDMVDVLIDVSAIYGERQQEQGNAGYDDKSCCKIDLVNDKVLYLREVDRCLALTCILHEETFRRQLKANLFDHNIELFTQAMREIFKVKNLAGGTVDAPITGSSASSV
eukprot:TRINITY_DN85466_c0_g1_i1.p1 TRINITY_DN85466_c0_g1~~TRINITY_DN85466_c0_g1_i1.p1  ORF type:complete len:340 (-),score=85.46 TRINITY_DN85466_c0_g1_i1:83-1102(-)